VVCNLIDKAVPYLSNSRRVAHNLRVGKTIVFILARVVRDLLVG
jgi:hypothetical protein